MIRARSNVAVPLLARVMGQDELALEEPLAALQRAEIAFPHRSPELEYVFKHVSMRETYLLSSFAEQFRNSRCSASTIELCGPPSTLSAVDSPERKRRGRSRAAACRRSYMRCGRCVPHRRIRPIGSPNSSAVIL